MKTETIDNDKLRSRLAGVQIVALVGGVGGAKLADGLAQLVPADRLTIIINTGDDFQHAGLTICPDIDTVLYTLAGVANVESGWGRAGETWRTIGEVGALGGPDWFRLGDLDLATHLTRSHLLANGATLTEATQHLGQHLNVAVELLPMSDQSAPTFVDTDEGLLPFQEWFVARRWQPAVREIILPDDIRATPQVLRALEKADLVLIAPSNPYVSIAPILNVFPIQAMITDLPELVIAVSPIIAGQAVKGPAAKMMAELGQTPASATVADYYKEIIDLFVYDERDRLTLPDDHFVGLCTDTLMKDRAGRRRLAAEILHFAMELTSK